MQFLWPLSWPSSLALLGMLLTAAAAAYAVLALFAVWRAGRARRPGMASFAPAVTVLKPLYGDEVGLEACLDSVCVQHYGGPVQIVFGLHSEADPALATARRVAARHPECAIDIVVDSRVCFSNRKVANLANMLRVARHAHLVLLDSDIHVGPDYLSRVLAPLAEDAVGVVTCLYRARPTVGRWSRLAGMFIDEWFAPSVWLAHWFGSRDYGFGATLALRRRDLDAIGGLAVVGDELADDYRLAAAIRGLGRRIELSDYLVETIVDEPELLTVLRHEARWMHTIRSLAPLSYAFLFITCTLPAALLGVMLAAGQPWALALAAIAVAARVLLHGYQNRRSPRPARLGLLLWPLREMLTLYDWIRGLGHRSVSWRGHAYTIGRGGSMQQQPMDRK